MAEAEWRESDLRYLGAVAESPDPIVTSTEVADKVGVTQQGAYEKLSDMQDRNLIRSKKVGAHARVWWLTIQGRDVYRESIS